VWTTYPVTLRPFNSFLIPLNLEKDLQPEQLVTIKLRNKASRWKSSAVASWQSSFCLLFKLIRISDLLSMEAVQLAQVLNSNLISEWLYWRKFICKRIPCNNTNRALRDTNADKITALLSPKKQLCFYCRILLVALFIALICSTTLSFDQMH